MSFFLFCLRIPGGAEFPFRAFRSNSSLGSIFVRGGDIMLLSGVLFSKIPKKHHSLSGVISDLIKEGEGKNKIGAGA